jgi:hypothetical protein
MQASRKRFFHPKLSFTMQMKSIVNALFVFLAVGIFACQDSTEPEIGAARVRVLLTDDPADYEEVNIDIQDVQINPEDDDGGWQSLENVNTGVYNLLELTGGLEAVLADVELPAGRINQLRLILGEDNTLMIDGKIKDLTTPSAQQSGLKIAIHTVLEEGVTYDILLDFDAARSVVKAGNSGKFILKPVIRASVEGSATAMSTGGIQGNVVPDTVQTLVTAIDDQQDSLSTFTDTVGMFLIQGLPPGTYDLLMEPDTASGLSDTTLMDILVDAGVITDVGTVDLTE